MLLYDLCDDGEISLLKLKSLEHRRIHGEQISKIVVKGTCQD